jgi:hypothetical protein
MDYVLKEKQGVLTADAGSDQRFNTGQSIVRFGIHEVICVPMKGRHETVGVLYMDTHSTARDLIQPAGRFLPPTESFETQKAAAGVFFDADVNLIGGGADGRRGMDQTFLGWANNLTTTGIAGRYTEAAGVFGVPVFCVSNRQAGTGSFAGVPVFLPGNPDPTALVLPVLDTGRENNALGGVGITLARSPDNGRGTVMPGPTLGETRRITAVDSPAPPFPRAAPGHMGSELDGVRDHWEFSTYLVGWTNSGGVAAAPPVGTVGPVGYRTYSVVFKNLWVVDGRWDITNTPGLAFPFQIVPSAGSLPPSIKLTNAGSFSPPISATAAGLEVRPPTFLRTVIYDSR